MKIFPQINQLFRGNLFLYIQSRSNPLYQEITMISPKMNNSIYYSEDEQQVKTQPPANQLHFQAQTDYQSSFDISIDEYQRLLQEKSASIPLKNVIFYQVKQPLSQESHLQTNLLPLALNIRQQGPKNQHKNQIKMKQRKRKPKIEYQEEQYESFMSSEFQEGQQFRTRSKYQLLAQIPCMSTRSRHQIPYNPNNPLRQLPIQPRTYHPPQTKFRHLDINQRRKRNMPPRFNFEFNAKSMNQGNLQISSLNLKQNEDQLKNNKQIYFSDDQELINIKELALEKEMKQIQPCVKQIQLNVAEPEKKEGRIIINRNNIIKMFEQSSLKFQFMSYETLQEEDPIYKWFFQQTIQDLSYKNSAQKSSHILSKGRLYLVRRAMQIYSNIPPKERKEERFVRNRLTKSQRVLMLKKNLPIPPPRLTSDFLAALFVNADFSHYFKHFIKSGKVEEILLNRNKEEIKNFGHYFRKICTLSISIQEKCKMIKQNPSPLSLLEVKLFMEEGRELCEKYC